MSFSLLIDTPSVSFRRWHPDRRTMLKMFAGAAALPLLGIDEQEAMAFPGLPPIIGNPLLVRAGLALLRLFVSGVVSAGAAKLLDYALESPRTKPNNFHDQHGPDYEVTRGSISPTETKYGYYLEVNRLARADNQTQPRSFKDMNDHEMRRLLHEEKTRGGILHPCDYRSRPGTGDMRKFANVCKQYNTDPEKLNLEYCRPFQINGNPKPGYGVSSKRTGQLDVLIEV